MITEQKVKTRVLHFYNLVLDFIMKIKNHCFTILKQQFCKTEDCRSDDQWGNWKKMNRCSNIRASVKTLEEEPVVTRRLVEKDTKATTTR